MVNGLIIAVLIVAVELLVAFLIAKWTDLPMTIAVSLATMGFIFCTFIVIGGCGIVKEQVVATESDSRSDNLVTTIGRLFDDER